MKLVKNHIYTEETIEFLLNDGRVFYIEHDKIDSVIKNKYPKIYNKCMVDIGKTYSLFDVEVLYNDHIDDLTDVLLHHSKLKL